MSHNKEVIPIKYQSNFGIVGIDDAAELRARDGWCDIAPGGLRTHWGGDYTGTLTNCYHSTRRYHYSIDLKLRTAASSLDGLGFWVIWARAARCKWGIENCVCENLQASGFNRNWSLGGLPRANVRMVSLLLGNWWQNSIGSIILKNRYETGYWPHRYLLTTCITDVFERL